MVTDAVAPEERTYAGIINILSLSSASSISPMNGLLSEAVRICVEQNITQLAYGRHHYAITTGPGMTG